MYLSGMKTTDILGHILPREFVEYFDLTSIEEREDQLFFNLDEKYELPAEHRDKKLESKGFLPASSLIDFPIRDRQVTLRIRRRKWVDKATGKTYTRQWDLKAKGTNYTKEFAAFLKEMLR